MNKFYVLILFLIYSHSFAQSHFFVKSDAEIPLLTSGMYSFPVLVPFSPELFEEVFWSQLTTADQLI